MLDFAIKGGTVVNAGGPFSADVGIEGDRIAVVAKPGALPPARKEIAADDLLILPGVIDIHFHVRAPAHPARGTWGSETRAAAAGGVTTLFEMPISNPGCARRDILEARRDQAQAESYVNFGLYGAPGLLDAAEIEGMAEAGAIGFKIFTHAAPADRADEFLGLCLENESDLYRVLEMTGPTGLITSFHAENQRLIELFGERIEASGRTDPRAFIDSRPPVVEAMSVSQLVTLCAATGSRTHIAHVSCAAALDQLQCGQRAGLPLTGETCPHYLFFDAGDMDRHGPFAAIKPPLRTIADQKALWAGLRDDSLMAITTDHSPFTLEEKERGRENIWAGAIGAPGIEALVPGVLTEALDGRITLEEAVKWLSEGPARLFGLSPDRGVVQPGARADLTIYDPRGEGRIDSSRWLSQSRVTDRLYHGRRVVGQVAHTIVGGTPVFAGGEIVAEAGGGEFVRPTHEPSLPALVEGR